MPKFRIPVSWSVSATMTIEADNLEDACTKAWDEDLPLADSDYVDNSFEVDSHWAITVNDKMLPPNFDG